MDIGSAVGREHGVTEDQLRDLPVYETSGAFSALEKLVLDYTVLMTRTPVEVPDALFEKLGEHLDRAQLIELSAAIAWENFRARFNHSLGIEAQGFSEGAYCAVPERHRGGEHGGTQS